MPDKISVLRLQHFADECRRAREHAQDSMTFRELAEFERKFRELASELEAAPETS